MFGIRSSCSFFVQEVFFQEEICCLCPAVPPDTDSKISVSFPFLPFTVQELLAYGL